MGHWPPLWGTEPTVPVLVAMRNTEEVKTVCKGDPRHPCRTKHPWLSGDRWLVNSLRPAVHQQHP